LGTKTDCVKAELMKNPNPTTEQVREIATRCNCSKAYVYKWMRKMPQPEPSGVPEAVEPVVKVEAEAEREVPEIEVEEAPKEFKEKAEPIEKLAEKMEAGLLTEDDLTYVFQSVNQLFPVKHQRPDKSMELLGKLWVKPANRLMEKYATENIDLYLAIGGTALVFAPSVVGMMREMRAKKPEKKKESEELVR